MELFALYLDVYYYSKALQMQFQCIGVLVFNRHHLTPSELISGKIKSKNSSGFTENLEREYISFCQNIIMSYFLTFMLINRLKLSKTSIFISITLTFAYFTNNCDLNTAFCNQMHRSFATIHYITYSVFKFDLSHNRSFFSPKYFCAFLTLFQSYRITKNQTFIFLIFFFEISLQIYI